MKSLEEIIQETKSFAEGKDDDTGMPEAMKISELRTRFSSVSRDVIDALNHFSKFQKNVLPNIRTEAITIATEGWIFKNLLRTLQQGKSLGGPIFYIDIPIDE